MGCFDFRYNVDMNILYTYQLNGNLAYLPRLFTHIQAISAQMTTKPLLLDLGGSCQSSAWHCDVTEGRSTLIVLDAMGYHGANIVNLLTPTSYLKLKDQVSLALVDENLPQWVQDTTLAIAPVLITGRTLNICLTPGDITGWRNGWLYLGKIASDELGIVQIDEGTIHHHSEKIPANTIPNPTISGVVDFVLAEARLYQNKKK